MSFTRKQSLFFSFALWFAVGVMLLYKGMGYLALSLSDQLVLRNEQPVLGFLTHLLGSHLYAMVAVVFFSVAIGYIKGAIAMKKSAERLLSRVASHGNAIPFSAVFPKWYIALVLGMMGLGIAIKYAPLYNDLRGMLDIAVGFALVSGALFFLNHLRIELIGKPHSN